MRYIYVYTLEMEDGWKVIGLSGSFYLPKETLKHKGNGQQLCAWHFPVPRAKLDPKSQPIDNIYPFKRS